MPHNQGEVGLQLDEDNALIANDDEDETSQTLVSSQALKITCIPGNLNIFLYIKLDFHDTCECENHLSFKISIEGSSLEYQVF